MNFAGYQLERKIGTGSLGTVYRAVDLERRARVAVKVFAKHVAEDIDLLERLERASELSRRIAHPNLLGIQRFDEAEGRYYYVMELLRCRPLAAQLEHGGVGAYEAVYIVHQLAKLLEVLHEQGLVHGAITAGHVLFARQGEPGSEFSPTVKLKDLGLSPLLANGTAAAERAQRDHLI